VLSLNYEESLKPKIMAGCDEVGRGPLAGSVYACAYIARNFVEGVNDSKKIQKKKRLKIYEALIASGDFAIGIATAAEIDEINILNATKLAIKRAVEAIAVKIDLIVVDGNMKFDDERFLSVIKGDQTIYSCAAASIIAKVQRDKKMEELSKIYPDYLWEKNSGYGTKHHIDAIKKIGFSREHRKSFCKNLI
jgi:ribonuclease HII